MARVWRRAGIPEEYWRGRPHHALRKGFISCLKREGADEEAVETLVDLMRHAKSDAARGAAAQALLDRGYGKSVAVSMDIVDEGQAHLEALQELADRRQRINREKTPAEATSAPPGWPLDGGPSAQSFSEGGS